MSATLPSNPKKLRAIQTDPPKSEEERANEFLRFEARQHENAEKMELLRADKARLSGQKEVEAAARKQARYYGFLKTKVLWGVEGTAERVPAPVSMPAKVVTPAPQVIESPVPSFPSKPIGVSAPQSRQPPAGR